MAPPRTDFVNGIYCKLAAVALFAVMDALVKWLGGEYPTMQVLLFRNIVSFVPVLTLIWWAGGWATIRTRQPGLQALRVAFGIGSLFTFFWTLPRLPLVEVYAISFAAPLMMTALTVPILGEHVGWRRWAAVVVGFVGTLIVLDFWDGSFGLVAAAVALATLFYSLSTVLIRRLARTDGDNATMFYFAVAATLLSGAACVTDPGSHWKSPSLLDSAALASLGLIGGVAQVFVTRSLRLAPPAILAPFEYTAIVFAFGLGYMFFGEALSDTVLFGLPLIIGSGLYILHRERMRVKSVAG